MNEMPGEQIAVGKPAASSTRLRRVWPLVHLVAVGIPFVLFFRPAFDWAAQQLEGGDEPWQLVLVPFLSAMVISRRVPELKGTIVKGCAVLGLSLMAAGAFLNLFGIVLEHPMPSQAGVVVFLNGVVLFVWGKRVYRGMAFPLLYLFFAVPLPRTVLVAMTGSLKILGAVVAGGVLSLLGMPLVREGAILKFPSFTLVVADECSGLQSLVTLSAASLPVAYLMEGRLWKKAFIVLLSLPLGLAANVLRLCVTAFLGQRIGEGVTRGWPHTLIGVVVVLLSFFALYGLSNTISEKREGSEHTTAGSGT
jgi:exosortase